MTAITLRNEFPGRVPGKRAEFDPSNANLGLQGQPYTVLLIGQKLDGSGSALPYVPTLVSGESDARDLFGVGSNLAAMVRAFRDVNSFTQLYAIAVPDDVGAVAASKTLTITGPATGPGTLSLLVAGVRIRVGVANGQTADEVRDAAVAAIGGVADLPVSVAAGGAGEIDFTARNRGEVGNEISVNVNFFDDERLPGGLSVAGAGFLTGGATNPTIAGLIPAAMGESWYNVIAFPWTDSASVVVLEQELADRFLPARAIDGLAIGAKRDSVANLLTFGGTRNSPHVPFIALEQSIGSPSYEFAAAVAGHVAIQGRQDPAVPYHDEPLGRLIPARVDQRFTVSDRDQLLNATGSVDSGGLSTLKASRDGQALIERLITTYKSTGAGAPDQAYLDVTTLLTLSRIRFDLNTRLAQKFAKKKIAKPGTATAVGDGVVTVETIRAEIILLARDWEAQGWVEDLDQLKAEIRVERDANDPGVVLVYLPPNLVNPLRQINTSIAFRL